MVNMIYNGPARRPRVRTTPTQRKILQQARFDQNIRDGQRLGAIPEAPTPLARPTNPTNNDITNPPDGANHQMPFEENLQDPAWLDDDPILAHASYHRMRRYAERREIISTQWTQLETQVTSAYLQCQRDTSNWTYQPQGLPAELCTCSSDDIHERQVDLIDILQHRPRTAIPFCKCVPDVVRLIHHGYFSSSADQPRTAFSIRLVQFHHFMWQSAVVSSSAFVKALAAFLGPRSNQAMFARILVRTKKILNDGLQLSKVDLWANKCPRCFGPGLNEVKSNPNEPDVIIAMDGNFQQRHYAHASKDRPRDDQYPVDFLSPSQLNADVTAVESTKAVAVGIDNYTNEFFEEQWRMEQEYHCRTNLTVKKQKIELGKLLCLKEALDTAWRNVVLTPEQALARATACATLTRKIADLRALVGDKLLTAVSGIETVEEQELLMKIWYNKTELRQKFLALLQEKQPLHGIRHLACLNRGKEEVRRLGWETRRAMRWASHRHNQLKTNIRLLSELSEDQQTSDDLPENLRPLVAHSYLLDDDSMSIRLQRVRVLLHSAYIEMMDLQLEWDPLISEILKNTAPQNDNGEIETSWNLQMSHIHWLHDTDYFSGIPGDMHDLALAADKPLPDNLPPPLSAPNFPPPSSDPNDNEEEDDGQQDYLEQMENVLSATMFNDLIQGGGSV
ncbi:hypothetical protein PtB15_7B618 [Puccinia triticina]|nr:hypothetical protein PtB15_7B618 [Puccinia triticina]